MKSSFVEQISNLSYNYSFKIIDTMVPDFLKEFPNLHPLFVLLLMACATIEAFIVYQACVYVNVDADEKAIAIFETHKLLATTTFWTSLFATVIRFITLKGFLKK